MSDAAIDKQVLEIETKARRSKDIDKLASSIAKLRAVTAPAASSLSPLSRALGELNTMLARMEGKTGSLSPLAAGLRKLATVNLSAADSAKRGKKEIDALIDGFDELNILNKKLGTSGSGSSSGWIGNILVSIEIPSDNLFEELVQIDITDKIEALKGPLAKMLSMTEAVGESIRSWRINEKIFGELETLTSKGFGLNKAYSGITLSISGLTLDFKSDYDIGTGGGDLLTWIGTTFSDAMGLARSLLVFGTSPEGILLGCGVLLTITLVGVALEGWDKAKREDLEGRFGDYVLSNSDIDDWAKQLTSSELNLGIDLYINEKESLAGLRTQLEAAMQTLRGYNFRVGLGLNVSQSDYKAAVDEYISSAQNYIEQHYVTSTMAIDLILGDSQSGTDLKGFTANFFDQNQAKLNDLGTRLKEVVATGFKDGVWIEDKFQESTELQKEIQEVFDAVQENDFKAQMVGFKMDIAASDISAESFVKSMETAESIIETQTQALKDARHKALTAAQEEYDYNLGKGGEEAAHALETLYKHIDDISAQYSEKAGALSSDVLSTFISANVQKFTKEIDAATPEVQKSLNGLMENVNFSGVLSSPETGTTYFDRIATSIKNGVGTIKDITPEAQANMQSLLNVMSPTEEEYLKIAGDSFAAGQAVPANVSSGLREVNSLKAVAGDVDGIQFLIGEKMSTSPEFLETLATCKGAGEKVTGSVADGLRNNLQVVVDEATGTLTLMNDTIGTKVLEITPELVENMNALGYDLSDGLITGASSQMQESEQLWRDWAGRPYDIFAVANNTAAVPDIFGQLGINIADSLVTGAESGMGAGESRWQAWSLQPYGLFNTLNGITPNTNLFYGLGVNLAVGLLNGADAGMQDKEEQWKTFALTPYDIAKLSNEAHSPSKLFSRLGGYFSDGLLEGAESGMQNNESKWRTWSLWPWNWCRDENDVNSPSKVFAELGGYLSDGLAEGLENKKSSLFERVSSWSRSVVDKVREKLGINSPSTVMRDEVGYYMAEGLKEGLRMGTDGIVGEAQTIADSVQHVFEGISYSTEVDYTALRNQAFEAGDTESAKKYESIRRAKIKGEDLPYIMDDDISILLWNMRESTDTSNESLSAIRDLTTTANDAETLRYENSITQKETDTKDLHEFVTKLMTDWTTAFNTFFTNWKSAMTSLKSEISGAAGRIVSSTDRIRINIYNSYGSGEVDAFASGGFPRQGSMFLASEAGPELVGTLGNRTAVVNNEQIVESVSEGVAEAVGKAMRQYGQSTENRTIIELDGDVIYDSSKKVEQRRGYNFGLGAFAR